MTLAGICVSALAGLMGSPPAILAGALVAILGAVLQDKQSAPYSIDLKSADWKSECGELIELRISRLTHMKPFPAVEMLPHGSLESLVSIDTRDDGTIVLTAKSPPDARLIVR